MGDGPKPRGDHRPGLGDQSGRVSRRPERCRQVLPGEARGFRRPPERRSRLSPRFLLREGSLPPTPSTWQSTSLGASRPILTQPWKASRYPRHSPHSQGNRGTERLTATLGMESCDEAQAECSLSRPVTPCGRQQPV